MNDPTKDGMRLQNYLEDGQMITGTPPFFLLDEERLTGTINTTKTQERRRTIRNWQRLWRKLNETAEWTRALIPDNTAWVQCQHRKIHNTACIATWELSKLPQKNGEDGRC
ncbi:hypothetical protein Trydic_g12452 [Trypoxylus dichotomus]